MIGTKYTSGLLAELAKTQHLRSMGIPTTPDGQLGVQDDALRRRRRGVDVYDSVLRGRRFAVRFHTGPQCGEGRSVPESQRAERVLRYRPVEFRAEVDAVCAIEETHTDTDKITSFFDDETAGDPWLVIVEPN